LLIGRARFRDPTKLFPVPLNEPNMFTASPEWQCFIESDRHGLRFATGRFLYSSFSFDIYLKRAIKRCTPPTLLMLASEDRVIDNAMTKLTFEQFGAEDRKVIEYAGAHHTLEFESRKHPFVVDFTEWINEKIRLS
jgi:alpha-beta hydrolase superfamily lysophospholipase